jgi:hypothetical protein
VVSNGRAELQRLHPLELREIARIAIEQAPGAAGAAPHIAMAIEDGEACLKAHRVRAEWPVAGM